MIENITRTPHGYRVKIGGVELNIPDDPGNRHWQVVQDAITNGAVVTQEQPPTLTEADFRTAIRNHVDAVAQAKNYDNAWSLGTYASSTIPEWAEQAQTFVAWRDQVWLFALAELAEIQAGTKPVPTIADLVASLPEIEWPE